MVMVGVGVGVGAGAGIDMEMREFGERKIKAGSKVTFDYILHTGQVREDVQVVLWPATWFHAHIYVLVMGTVAVKKTPLRAARRLCWDRVTTRRMWSGASIGVLFWQCRRSVWARNGGGLLRGAGDREMMVLVLVLLPKLKTGVKMWRRGCFADKGPSQRRKSTRDRKTPRQACK